MRDALAVLQDGVRHAKKPRVIFELFVKNFLPFTKPDQNMIFHAIESFEVIDQKSMIRLQVFRLDNILNLIGRSDGVFILTRKERAVDLKMHIMQKINIVNTYLRIISQVFFIRLRGLDI